MHYNFVSPNNLTDEELVRLVQARDESAFSELVSRYSPRIWNIVVENSRQRRDAEEILMDIWMAVWENIIGLRKAESFGGWLRKIARTACNRYYASGSHRHSEIMLSNEELSLQLDRDAVQSFRETSLREDVREAVHHLPQKVRSVAVLYYLELWSIKEIAEELNLASGTIKTRLREIRELLRTEFGVEVSTQERIMSSEVDHLHSQGEHIIAGQYDKNLENCTENLVAIGKAIQKYLKDRGHFPKWLSELHPNYVTDKNILRCPADKGRGQPIWFSNTDPKLPVSYGYQYHPAIREWKSAQRLMYGDIIPMVRCRHHANEEFECLNLSFSFKIYRSAGAWEFNPEEIYETREKAIAALEVGLDRHSDNELFFHAYLSLTHLYIKAGRDKDADNLIDRFKSVMTPNRVRDRYMLGDMLKAVERHEDALQTFEKLEKEFPNNRNIFRKLAEIHEVRGNAELAKDYQYKVDPTQALIGKPVLDFSPTDLDGKPISLREYRGKVVLLDFWAAWCGPCIEETPNLKRVYEKYKDKGFEIIGVSLDTDESKLRDYLKANDIPWRQIFSGLGWKSPVAQQYEIKAIPAMRLIDREGNLISPQARGAALGKLVAEAVKDK